MTFEELEKRYLSLRHFCQRIVLPTALLVLCSLLFLKLLNMDALDLDRSALLIGLFGLYFVLVRGGHLWMIRSMHIDMKTRYQKDYARKLGSLPLRGFHRFNIGFSLARIKRELIDEARKKHQSFLQKL